MPAFQSVGGKYFEDGKEHVRVEIEKPVDGGLDNAAGFENR